ncbi:MAG: hypothetical protein ACYTFI_24195 [Planctomycetota bacterium]|jgi:hypothetical protein
MTGRLSDPFLLLLARLTDPELARAVQFLKVENAMLRSRLPKPPPPEETRTKHGVACDMWLGGLLKHYRRAA